MTFVDVMRMAAWWGTAAVFCALLAGIAWKDFRTMRIPDRMNLEVLAVGAVSVFTMPGPGLLERLAGMFAVSLPMLFVTFFVPGGFGGGDIKLMAASGLFLGVEGNVLAVLLGLFGGGLFAVMLVLVRKAGRRDAFPFGPFLCGGILAAFVILCRHGSYHMI